MVTLTFEDRITPEQLAGILDGLRSLPDTVPEIESYEVGTDLGRAEGNASLGIVADFASWADYETYRDHPVHRALLHDQIRPVLATRCAVQHERAT